MTTVTVGKATSGPVELDVNRLIESRLLVTASSGGGKSWLLRKILEQVSAKTQTIVIDVEGEFATLREKRDMVLAGPNGEVPADVRSAGLLCRRLMELNLSAVIDVSELKPSDKRRFVALFCNTMVELPRSLWRPCFVCIDETHEFAPEGEKAESTDAVALLGSKGRKRGYCLLAATQRLSKLNKDVAAECRNQFIGMMNLDVDLKRAADVLGFQKDRWPELRDLSPPGREGEFFCFGPALGSRHVEKMRAGQVESTHPKAGQGRLSKPPEPSAKISGVLGELKDLAKKADEEAKTLADAKREISELKRQLNSKPAPAAAAIDRTVIAEYETRERGYKTAIRDLNKALDAAHARAEKAAKILGSETAIPRAPSIDPAAVRSQNGANTHGQTGRVTTARSQLVDGQSQAAQRVNVSRQAKRPESRTESPALAELQLGKPERRILTALYWTRGEQKTPSKIGFYSDYTADGGSFKNAIGRLRSIGLVRGFELTSEGEALAETIVTEDKPRGHDLREWLRQKLGSPENKLLDALCEAYPNRLSDEELGQLTGYEHTGGSYKNALGRLRTLEAAEGYARDGGTKAADVFFE